MIARCVGNIAAFGNASHPSTHFAFFLKWEPVREILKSRILRVCDFTAHTRNTNSSWISDSCQVKTSPIGGAPWPNENGKRAKSVIVSTLCAKSHWKQKCFTRWIFYLTRRVSSHTAVPMVLSATSSPKRPAYGLAPTQITIRSVHKPGTGSILPRSLLN